jgi:site-specific recombinase XerD
LAALRASGEQPDRALSKWLEGLPRKIREKLAKWELLDSTAVAGSRPLAEHLREYKQALLDGAASPRQKGPATEKHATTVCGRIEELLDGVRAKYLGEVKLEQVARYLTERRTQRPRNSKKRLITAQTANHWATNAKSFFNWMIRTGRATRNPLACLSRTQVTPKLRKLVRRSLEVAEAQALLDATRSGSTRYGMPSEERYWLYRIALETALRSKELRALHRMHFELAATICLVKRR